MSIQNFTLLHSNRRLGTTSAASSSDSSSLSSYCPSTVPCASMDLLCVGMIGSNSNNSSISSDHNMAMYHSIVIHRTLSWQKLLVISCDDLSSSYLDTLRQQELFLYSHNNNNKDTTALVGPTAFTWSPQGRSFVVGLSDGSFLVYDLESYCHEMTKNPSSIDLTSIYSSSIVRYVVGPPPLLPSQSSDASKENKEDEIKMESKPRGGMLTRSSTASTGQQKRLLRRMGKTPETPHKGGSTLSSKTASPSHAIVAMTWTRFSYSDSSDNNKHSTSSSSCLDKEAWKWHQRYVDRSSYFLPPSMYHYSRFIYDTMGKKTLPVETLDTYTTTAATLNRVEDDPSVYILGHHRPISHGTTLFQDATREEDRMVHVDPTWPRGQTILSALCVLTSGQGICIYLHGRFPMLEIPSPLNTSNYSNTQQAHILCTFDLSTVVVWNTRIGNNSTLLAHVYTVPRIRQERYPLQILSSFYSSIQSHVSTIKMGMKDIMTAWNSALRPLDVKWDPMIKLFKDYGILNPESHISTGVVQHQASIVRLHLLQYILRGHVNGGDTTTTLPSTHTTVSNALDHFFTQASMNDALLVRLSKSMVSNLAQLEGTVRKYLMGPVQALLYDVYELYGYAHYFSSYGKIPQDDESNRPTPQTQQPLIQELQARELLQAAENIRLVLEIVLHQLIEVRFRVTHIIEWLRGTAAQVKARGTPIDSIQREHAKKRRVSDSILRHLTYFLSLPTPPPTTPSENHTIGWTESILGILWSNLFLSDTFEYTPLDSQRVVSTPSFKAVFEKLMGMTQTLFLQPRQVLSKCVQHYEIVVERETNSLSGRQPLLVAFHKRCGGSTRSKNSDTTTGFVPKLFHPLEMNAHMYNQTQWLLAALYFEEGISLDSFIEIIALPTDSLLSDQRYYLSSRLSLPPLCKITDLKFYGDDGCGAFKVEHVETIQEGRQALGLIVERATLNKERNVSEELWLFDYDSLLFRYVSDGIVLDDVYKWKIQIHDVDGSEELTTSLRTALDPSDGKMSDHHRPKIAKSRVVHTNRLGYATSCSRLILNGARGVGGVTSISGSSITLDLFDLEEDEEMDD